MSEHIYYKVVDIGGILIYEEGTETAFEHIKQFVVMERKWLFLDGNSCMLENLSADILRSSKIIILTSAIIGG